MSQTKVYTVQPHETEEMVLISKMWLKDLMRSAPDIRAERDNLKALLREMTGVLPGLEPIDATSIGCLNELLLRIRRALDGGKP